jgi:ABC-2 type transport system permease protein
MLGRRMVALMGRDLRSSLREFILIYGLTAPYLLALILRVLLPSAAETSVRLVLTPDIDSEMAARLREYARVEVVGDRAALERRVLALDDAAGLVVENGRYVVVLEGNEGSGTRVLPGVILARILSPDPLTISEVDLGRTGSPLRPVLGTVLAMTALLMGGMVIGFNIIEDKETGTISALAVSPLSRAEYVAGRSVLGILLSLALVVGSLYLVGAGPFDLWKVLTATAAGSLLVVLYGLYTGGVSNNQIAGIATTKVGGLIFLLGPVLSLLLSERLQPVLYWLPTYWTYRAYLEILSADSPWPEVLRLSGASLAASLLILAGAWGFFRRRLFVGR